MKLKNAFLLLAFTAILFSCQKEEETVVVDTNADLTTNAVQFDNSNYGVYEGTFTTLDSENRGVVVISLKEDNNGRASLKLGNGADIKLAVTETYTEGTDTNVLFSGQNVSLRFSVNGDGSEPIVSDVIYNGQNSSIKVLKETSRAPVVPLTGTYEFNGVEDTFSLTFTLGDGSGADTDITTSIIANGVDIGTATGNAQSNCVVDTPEVGLTQCDITGSAVSPNTMNAITWAGVHIYDSGIDGCSQFNGTWTAGGGQSGTFTNDNLCETQPGDVPGTAIAIVPNADGTGCTPAGDQTANLGAGGGYTDSGQGATACADVGVDIWYTYTSTTNGLNIFPQSGSSTTVPSVAAYTFDAFGGTYTEVGCGAGNFGGAATIAITGWTAGDDVYIRMQASVDVPFCMEEVAVATGPPANDTCLAAEPIACGDVVSGSTLTATDTDAARAADVWYVFTSAGEEVTVSLCGSSFDTWLGVYDDCAQTTVIASNDDSCGAQSELTFLSVSGTDYFIKVDGFNSSNVGAFDIAITCIAGPTCTDGILNGDETGIDCGGATCPACPPAPSCTGVTTTETGGTGAIADNACPTQDLFVATTAEIGTIGVDTDIDNVEITISHTWMSDLEVNLVSPIGTSMVLANGLGGQTADGNAYVNTVFRDGESSITTGSSPFTGNFEAEGGRFGTVFAGESITGDWSLSVCDGVGGDVGTVDSFTISFCDGAIMDPPAPAPVDPTFETRSAADKANTLMAKELYNQKQQLKK